MSDISSSDAKKPMEQPNEDLSKAMGQLSVTSNDSNKNPSTKNLCDMPLDVVGMIIERSEYKEQLKLRKVSKSFRALIDNQKPACESIIVDYDGTVCIKYNNHSLIYRDYAFHDNLYYDDDDCHKIFVIRDNSMKVAFDDLASTLKNPKLQLEELSCGLNSGKKDVEECYNEIRNILKSLNHQVSVKKFYINLSSPSCLLSILPYLKPRVLEKIDLALYDYDAVDLNIHSTEMDQIARLEQWKQPEEIGLRHSFDWFPMEYATHFKRFRFCELSLSEDKLSRIKDFLSQLDNFEHCTLFSFDSRNRSRQLLGTPVSSNSTEEVFHHSIGDSDYYFQFNFTKESRAILIVKKKRDFH